MSETFIITIDGRRVEARAGEYVLATARRAGVAIPTLCEHKAVEPFGACRLCMVEVTKPAWKGWKGLMTACLYPSTPDLVVETASERVLHVRKNVLDLLLARCPGSTLIQRLAAEHGVHETSFVPREDPDLCILCGLCTRVCESAATAAIATVKRGHEREVGTPWGGPPPDCIGCLACAHVCPTGHITWSEKGGRRAIWGREFELARCAECGAALPLTVPQAAFLAKRQPARGGGAEGAPEPGAAASSGLDASYFARCASCQRRSTARTLGRLAHWSRLGLEQEEVKP
jgi:NADH dehydrogenase/NADH:ubiquinone oxidoreductase subunit G